MDDPNPRDCNGRTNGIMTGLSSLTFSAITNTEEGPEVGLSAGTGGRWGIVTFSPSMDHQGQARTSR
jgi:hypothetical protein